MIVTSIRTRAAIAAAAAAVIAALTAGTAIAGADAKDDAFVAALQKLGITGEPLNIARAMGLMICGDLASGRTPDQIAQDFEQQGPAIVAAAKQVYCP
jgi:acetylornithine/succinyldiaminopimelate/putrescine aminotransferase